MFISNDPDELRRLQGSGQALPGYEPPPEPYIDPADLPEGYPDLRDVNGSTIAPGWTADEYLWRMEARLQGMESLLNLVDWIIESDGKDGRPKSELHAVEPNMEKAVAFANAAFGYAWHTVAAVGTSDPNALEALLSFWDGVHQQFMRVPEMTRLAMVRANQEGFELGYAIGFQAGMDHVMTGWRKLFGNARENLKAAAHFVRDAAPAIGVGAAGVALLMLGALFVVKS